MEKKNTEYSTHIKERFPELGKEWTRLINEIGIDLVNFIKDKISSEYSFLKELSQFKFKIIVDNNFIFGQIKGSIRKKKTLEESFLFKLLMSTSIEMFGPFKLQEELFEKINTVLEEEDREIGTSYAVTLLSKIKIQDAQWTDDWKKANNLIGEYDPDDVSYLALAFDLNVHSILTQDDVFHRQGDFNVWRHNDMGKVLANYNSGFVSMVMMDFTGQLLWKILAIAFKFIRDSLASVVHLLVDVAKGLINGVFKLPPLVIAGLIGLGIIFADEIKEHGKNILIYIIKKAKEILQRVRIALKEIIDLLQKAFDTVLSGATVTFEFLGFLLDEYWGLYNQIRDLNIDFPPQLIPDPRSIQTSTLKPLGEKLKDERS